MSIVIKIEIPEAPKLASELPEEVLVEIGLFATDWAVIEQNLAMHTVEMCGRDPQRIPKNFTRGFSSARKCWHKIARELNPERAVDIDRISDRLTRRSEARNYALHGYWKQKGPEEFDVIWIDLRGGKVEKNTISTNLIELREQTALLRDVRIEFISLVNDLLEKIPI
jgi:hypothetical protein